jgi:hypothetical protein
MYKLLRVLLFIPQPRVTREQALEIAQKECERRGWTWRDPTVVDQLRTWLIWSQGDIIGPPFVVVHQQTGEVVNWDRGLRR